MSQQPNYEPDIYDFEPAPPRQNIKCCHVCLKSITLFKEFIIMIVSSTIGIFYLVSSILVLMVLIPFNLYHTIGLAIENLDLYINVALVFGSLNNLAMSLHLLTITGKQKRCLKYLAKRGCGRRAKDEVRNTAQEEVYVDPQDPAERLNKLIQGETQSICHEVAHRILHPSKAYLAVAAATLLSQSFFAMLARQFYYDPRNQEIYQIYQGARIRNCIQIIIYITSFGMAINILIMMIFLFVFLLTGCESCILDSCLPEFKGTYDEEQDEIFTMDFDGQSEVQRARENRAMLGRSELNFANEEVREEQKQQLNPQEESYTTRLSTLQLTYEQLAHKHHKMLEKNKSATGAGYQQVSLQLPKSCSICFENFKTKSLVIGLDCNKFKHVFHWSCLLSWLKRQRSCPLCRKEIQYLLPRSLFYCEDKNFDFAEMQRYRHEVEMNIVQQSINDQ